MQIVGERYTTAKSFSCHGYGSVIKLKDKQLDQLEFDEVNVMNELVYRNLSEEAKRQICAWKYGGEYDLYNLPDYEEMQVRQMGFMNPKSEKKLLWFLG